MEIFRFPGETDRNSELTTTQVTLISHNNEPLLMALLNVSKKKSGSRSALGGKVILKRKNMSQSMGTMW